MHNKHSACPALAIIALHLSVEKNSQCQIESYPQRIIFCSFPIVALLVSIDVVIMTAWQIVDPFFREIKDLEPIVSIS